VLFLRSIIQRSLEVYNNQMTRLELHRRTLGLSQSDLAAKIHYSAPVISRLENGALTSKQTNIRLKLALEEFFKESFEALMQPVGDVLLESGVREK